MTDKTLGFLEEKINETLNQAIPIRFVYTQLPFTPEPQVLWKWAVWFEITGDYEGHFFRALGGNSAPFGESQMDSVQKHPFLQKLDLKIHMEPGDEIYEPDGNEWFKNLRNDLRLSSETRPLNFAVRIWERVY